MTGEASRAVKLCGTELGDPPTRLLKAGALSVELENGALRYVRLGEVGFCARLPSWSATRTGAPSARPSKI